MKNKRSKPKLIRSPAVKRSGTGHPADSISLRPNWERRLKELEAFKKEHGHCNVPAKYSPNPPLAHWVAHVRSRRQSSRTVTELARRLDELGFTWSCVPYSPSPRLGCDGRRLTAFKNQHGHCCVPSRPAKYRTLGMWLIEVRRRKRSGRLDRGRIRQLDRLGVVWKPQGQQWEKMFAELVAYRAKYGDCKVPTRRSENPRWIVGGAAAATPKTGCPQGRPRRTARQDRVCLDAEWKHGSRSTRPWSNTSGHTATAECLPSQRIMPAWANGSAGCVDIKDGAG